MSKVFRVEKTRDFTVMSNHHIRNKNLSLKAKGLLTIMLSLPDEWDFTMEGLARLSKDEITSVRSTLKELAKSGYVKMGRVRKPNGQYGQAEYVIYEYPVASPDDPESIKKADEDETNAAPSVETSISDKSMLAKPISDAIVLDQPILENPIWDEPIQEKHRQLNTNISNTYLSNTDDIKYLSINQRAHEETVSTTVDKPLDRWIDRYNKTLAEVKEQLDYETLILSNNKELINDIVETMTEVFVLDTPYYTICGKEIPTEYVRIQYRKITYSRLESFLIEFSRLKTKIGNTKRYLISALYNVASTAETAMTNMVNYDLNLK